MDWRHRISATAARRYAIRAWSARSVLRTLLTRSDRLRPVVASQASLADASGCGRASVRHAVRTLVSAGLIDVAVGSGRTISRYRFNGRALRALEQLHELDQRRG
jgi:biotin operon repressor